VDARRNHRQATIEAQFVVDTLGRAKLETIKLLGAKDSDFRVSVCESLKDTRFIPAMSGGHLIPQLVDEPFIFTLSH
jgi:hypothetical protein